MMQKRILAGAIAVAAAISVAACGGDDSGDSGSSADLSGQSGVFVIFDITQEDQFATAFADPVSEETGLRVTFDAPTDYAKLQAQVESDNVSWTVVQADPWWAEDNCPKLIEEVDVTVPGGEEFASGPCAVPGDTFAFIQAYDSEAFGDDPPSSWDDFFDTEKYPGKRAVWGSYALNGMLEGALLADGVAPEDLYPLDLDRAFAKLDTIRDDITFYDTVGQAVQLMQSGEAAFVVATNAQGYLQAQEGGSFEPIWNEALLSWDAYVVPKGADTDAAQPLLEQIASAEGQTLVAEESTNGVVNPEADPQLSSEQEVWSPAGGDNAEQTIQFGNSYYAKHADQVIQAWTDWVSG